MFVSFSPWNDHIYKSTAPFYSSGEGENCRGRWLLHGGKEIVMQFQSDVTETSHMIWTTRVCILVLMVFNCDRSGPDFSKITTIHGNPNLIDEESERISKIIKGEYSRTLVFTGLSCFNHQGSKITKVTKLNWRMIENGTTGCKVKLLSKSASVYKIISLYLYRHSICNQECVWGIHWHWVLTVWNTRILYFAMSVINIPEILHRISG